jgi:hypothetical protein
VTQDNAVDQMIDEFIGRIDTIGASRDGQMLVDQIGESNEVLEHFDKLKVGGFRDGGIVKGDGQEFALDLLVHPSLGQRIFSTLAARFFVWRFRRRLW